MTYTIQKDRAGITCHFCGVTSWNKNDVDNLYCGGCHRFHADHPPSEALLTARRVLIENLTDDTRSPWQRWLENR